VLSISFISWRQKLSFCGANGDSFEENDKSFVENSEVFVENKENDELNLIHAIEKIEEILNTLRS
jgi:hypothetical protein